MLSKKKDASWILVPLTRYTYSAHDAPWSIERAAVESDSLRRALERLTDLHDRLGGGTQGAESMPLGWQRN